MSFAQRQTMKAVTTSSKTHSGGHGIRTLNRLPGT